MNRKSEKNRIWIISKGSTKGISATRELVQNLAKKINLTPADQIFLTSAYSNMCRILLEHFSSFNVSIREIQNRRKPGFAIRFKVTEIKKESSSIKIKATIQKLLSQDLKRVSSPFDEVISPEKSQKEWSLILKKWSKKEFF